MMAPACGCGDVPDPGCLPPNGQRMAHTACVSCGTTFNCEGDIGASTHPDERGYIYPVCHPQDCRPPTDEQKAAWDALYRTTV